MPKGERNCVGYACRPASGWGVFRGDCSIARIPFNQAPSREGPRVNTDISAPNVRVVDEKGEQLGVISVSKALELAEAAALDLVEVAPGADPPVCKILDYGKFKYEAQKKKNEARKKQKIIDVKEIKMRPGIDDHDYQVKMRNMRRFLEDGDKVKVTIRFRGREMAHQNLGMKVLDRVREELDELSKVEQYPKIEGRQMVMVIAPR
jgi:translation initiation factor IF-3